jgi:D-alanyl-D-alanine dipeptidase
MKAENLSSKAIPNIAKVNWEDLRKIKIIDNHEDLISMSLIPEKIIVQPQYYLQGIKGALSDCYIRKNNLNRIVEAAEMLEPGYKFLIYDAWRPPEVQKIIFQKYFNELREKMPKKSDSELKELTSRFVSLPSKNAENPSPHLTGGAVDLTIIDNKGKVLNMGTAFDETSEKAATYYYEELKKMRKLNSQEEEILKNRRMLYHVMTEVGFVNYAAEWWHYDYGDQLWAYLNETQDYAVYGRTKPELRWINIY